MDSDNYPCGLNSCVSRLSFRANVFCSKTRSCNMGPIMQCFGIAESEYPIITVNVSYVMGFRPSYFTYIAYLYLYYTCTAHIYLLYKGTNVYSFIMKYNTNLLVFLTWYQSMLIGQEIPLIASPPLVIAFFLVLP